jgi:hypothetical protein
VCVCLCVREIEIEWTEWSVFMCVLERKRERIEGLCVRERDREEGERGCVCVCVKKKERG